MIPVMRPVPVRTAIGSLKLLSLFILSFVPLGNALTTACLEALVNSRALLVDVKKLNRMPLKNQRTTASMLQLINIDSMHCKILWRFPPW